MYSPGTFAYDASMTHETQPSTPRGELLDEAKHLITGDRNVTYGEPTDNFKNIAAMWNAQFGHKFKEGESFQMWEVAIALVLLKCARSVAQPKRDNFVDLAGYGALAWECRVADVVADDEMKQKSIPEEKRALPAPHPDQDFWHPLGGQLTTATDPNTTVTAQYVVPETVARVQEELRSRHKLTERGRG